MTTYALAPSPVLRFFDNNGNALVGGQVATYAAGSSTPLATYTDSTGGTPNTNPIILNFRGEAAIWLPVNVAYKFVVSDALGNLIPGGTTDQIVNLSLVSLYGGTDTGVANAYILNFPSPLPPTTTGQVVFWIPSNSNTGPSTLNVNGGGATPILNPNGTPLGANQLLAGQFVSTIYLNGIWQLYGGSGVGVNVGTFGTEVPIPSATTTDLGSVPGHNVQITGTTAITSFGNSAQIVAPIYVGRFSGALTLTNSSSLMLPGGNNITTSNGDSFIAEYLGSGVWKVLFYQYVAATSSTSSVKSADTARLSTTTLTADPDLSITLLTGQYSYELFMLFDSVAAGAGFKFQSVGTAVDSRATSPAVADGLVNAAAYGPKLESFVGATISYATVSTTADSNGVLYKGSLLVTTPGTFGIQWAQAVSTASNTTLRAGSYLTANLLAQKAGNGPVQHLVTTAGSGTEIIPAGYTTVMIEVWGGTDKGGNGSGAPNFNPGGGAGSAGYSRSVYSVSGLGGQTMGYTVGAAGTGSGAGLSQVTSGSFTLTTMTSNPGIQGQVFGAGAAGGAGGAASGGNQVNTSGNPGAHGGPGGGLGGAGIPGINYGGSNGPNGSGTTAANGNPGAISWYYQ